MTPYRGLMKSKLPKRPEHSLTKYLGGMGLSAVVVKSSDLDKTQRRDAICYNLGTGYPLHHHVSSETQGLGCKQGSELEHARL